MTISANRPEKTARKSRINGFRSHRKAPAGPDRLPPPHLVAPEDEASLPRAPATPAWEEVFLGGSPAKERALFVEFARDIQRLQEAVQKRDKARTPERGFHNKPVLGGRAVLSIATNLPSELRAGFLVPGREHSVIYRISSASWNRKSDRKFNGHGIAFRIQTEGQFYDLTFADSPASHARDASEFMAFARMLSVHWVRWPFHLARALSLPRAWHLAKLLPTQVFPAGRSIAHMTFWSKVPMRINQLAVKYTLKARDFSGSRLRDKSPDYLRGNLLARLAHSPVVYDLYIQRFVDEQHTPIEDHTVEWHESVAPLEKIGELTLLPRGQAEPLEDAKVEALTFNPWNTIDALRPLGSFNRARKFVYGASAERRLHRPERSLVERVAEGAIACADVLFTEVNKYKPWHEFGPILGTLNLMAIRHRLRHENLHDTNDYLATLDSSRSAPAQEMVRDADGRNNDLAAPEMGARGQRFGRNVPTEQTARPDMASLLEPNPRELSQQLLRRQAEHIPATSLNLLAAAWIQFQTHDWFAHKETKPGREILVPIADSDLWTGPRPMKVRPSQADNEGISPATFSNDATHWWDGSQLYGASAEQSQKLRDGHKLKLSADGLLLLDENKMPLTGFNRNWWLGLDLMHVLFAREHNQIADMLKRHYPNHDAKLIFDRARLINVAAMAKIHTIEWTPAILAHPTLKLSMDAHWWGLAGKQLQGIVSKLGDAEVLRGIPGSRREHFEVPFALTQEFISVYRLHPLLPDELTMRHLDDDESQRHEFNAFAFDKSQTWLKQPLESLYYSFGTMHPGAMCLQNYPRFLLDLKRDGQHIDVGAVDILRDRERGVPRYNAFRKALHMQPATSFEALCNDRLLREKLRTLYNGDIDNVDLLVGMLAEKPPPGFGFSDTAFRVFVLMASRRLKSDRFFTDSYNAQTYTPEGLSYLRDVSMKSILLHHFPKLTPALAGVDNAFAPWRRLRSE